MAWSGLTDEEEYRRQRGRRTEGRGRSISLGRTRRRVGARIRYVGRWPRYDYGEYEYPQEYADYLMGRPRYDGRRYPAMPLGRGGGGPNRAPSTRSQPASSGNADVTSYAEEVERARQEARESNESRYQEILTGMEGLGRQEARDISRRYRGLRSGAEQDLISRGLAGTTVLPGVRALYGREETAALSRLNARLARERFGFMERRSDTYPDERTLLGLAQAAGRTGGMATSGAGQTPARPTARSVGGPLAPAAMPPPPRPRQLPGYGSRRRWPFRYRMIRPSHRAGSWRPSLW